MNYLKSKSYRMIRPIMLKWYWSLMNRRHHHNVKSWSVGRQARIGYKAIVREGVEIGNDVVLGDYSYISGPRTYVESARIGKFCSIARQTVIDVGNHDHSLVTTHPFIISPEFGELIDKSIMVQQKPAPIIGNDVWIGINSIVMRGVSIGDGAVIAANSVVTRDVPPYAIFGGVPAKLIRYRFSDEIVRALLQIRWWDWPSSKLRQNVRDFSAPESFVAIHAVSGTDGE